MVFRSKVDTWLLAVVGVADAGPVLFAISQHDRLPLEALVVVLVACSFATSLSVLAIFGIRYELEAEALVARVGPLRWRVPYAAMTGVSPTRDPASAPAASLDRLRIEWTDIGRSGLGVAGGLGGAGVPVGVGRPRVLLVSPAEREPFLEALRERAPQLRGASA